MARFAIMPGRWFERDRTAVITLALFALIYGLICFPNHVLLRTYALDLGVYTHALWEYAHFRLPDCSLFLEIDQPLLADHFDLYLPLLSPLVYLFGTWTLLIVQWAAMLAGAWGLRRLLLTMGFSPALAMTGMVVLLAYFGMFAAVSFDYHSNVVAAMLLPWFLLAVWKGARGQAILLFVMMLLAKENMGFWIGTVALVLAFEPSLSRAMRRASVWLGLVAFTYSIVVIGAVMPALAANASYAHFDYGILGTNLGDLPARVITHPLSILQAFFSDHRGVANGTAIKLEFWCLLLLSGGWAFFLAPRWGLMALPLIAQKMLHDDPGKWSVVAHYGVELGPLLAVAVPLAVKKLPAGRAHVFALLAVAGAAGCTIRFMDNTVAFHSRSRVRFYQEEHYVREYDIDEVRRALALIPADASVSAQSPAVPQLALRAKVYQYPIVRDAEYILLLTEEDPYPMDRRSYTARLEDLSSLSSEWSVAYSNGSIVLHRRTRAQ